MINDTQNRRYIEAAESEQARRQRADEVVAMYTNTRNVGLAMTAEACIPAVIAMVMWFTHAPDKVPGEWYAVFEFFLWGTTICLGLFLLFGSLTALSHVRLVRFRAWAVARFHRNART